MFIQYKNITIRNATVEDAELLAKWWNDGKIMVHAGFPNGTGETPSDIADRIAADKDDRQRRFIIEIDGIPVGEMSYYNVGNHTAEIGIKICDFSMQNIGYGKIILCMFINSLFTDYKYERIILDTNVKNERAQHVYEELGFRKLGIRENSWRNQLGELQSSIDYEMKQNELHTFR